MKLPNCEKSYIPQPKLTNYLLSETHAVGKSKAVFLRAIGFSGNNVSDLEGQLLEIARTEDVVEVKETPYGTNTLWTVICWHQFRGPREFGQSGLLKQV